MAKGFMKVHKSHLSFFPIQRRKKEKNNKKIKRIGETSKKPMRRIYFHFLIYNEQSWRAIDLQHYFINQKSTSKFTKRLQKIVIFSTILPRGSMMKVLLTKFSIKALFNTVLVSINIKYWKS